MTMQTKDRGLDIQIRHYWYPLRALSHREIRKRYAPSILGAGWTLLQPLALVLIYFFVFGFVLRSGRDAISARDFAFNMLIGLLPYFAIAEGLQRASASLREDRALLDQALFPAEVVPASRVLSASVGEAVGLTILTLAAILTGKPVNGWLLALPLLVALRILITFGIAWIVSTLAMFVTDTAELLAFALTAWLFLTPIFYSADVLPPALQWMTAVNPLHRLVEAYRSVILSGQAPLPDLLALVAWAAALATLGLWFFRKTLERGKDCL